jgi:hypothetical protein
MFLSGVELAGGIVMGDRAYGTVEIRGYIKSQNATYRIPPKKTLRIRGIATTASTRSAMCRMLL